MEAGLGPRSGDVMDDKWIQKHEAIHVAERIAYRAEHDDAFAAEVKADPTAALVRMGISAEVAGELLGDTTQERLGEVFPDQCVDFTCWTSHCPGTCIQTVF
jgi:hypothetical protein